MPTHENRRRFERFVLNPAYTPIAVRFMNDDHFRYQGHAYDISEGGLQFELDRGIEPGTRVAVQITLPVSTRIANQDVGPGRSVFAFGTVVWLDDEEPGPVRLALAFTSFAREGDRERLLARISHGELRRAA